MSNQSEWDRIIEKASSFDDPEQASLEIRRAISELTEEQLKSMIGLDRPETVKDFLKERKEMVADRFTTPSENPAFRLFLTRMADVLGENSRSERETATKLKLVGALAAKIFSENAAKSAEAAGSKLDLSKFNDLQQKLDEMRKNAKQ